MLMNKKGFSLVEMLLVLVLIAIVSLIILPNINKMLTSSKDREITGYKKLITENLEMYVIDKAKSISWNSNTVTLDLSELKKVNPDIDIDTCSIKNDSITITRTEKDTIVSEAYSYEFDFCLICDEKEYCN